MPLKSLQIFFHASRFRRLFKSHAMAWLRPGRSRSLVLIGNENVKFVRDRRHTLRGVVFRICYTSHRVVTPHTGDGD